MQLETRRGLFGITLSVSRNFIPADAIRDILINEALAGWQFKHYLAVVEDSGSSISLAVAFEVLPFYSITAHIASSFQNILPNVQTLSAIYRELHNRD